MAKPLYYHPFLDKNHKTGVIGVRSARVSLHFIAPTFARAKFASRKDDGAMFSRYTARDDRIYVLGHGQAGIPTITTDSGLKGSASKCGAWELASLFKDGGLPKNSEVTIRIHSCHSAKESEPGKRNSFAHIFDQAMRKFGYDAVTIQGYNVGVGPYIGYRMGDWGLPISTDAKRVSFPPQPRALLPEEFRANEGGVVEI